MKPNPTVCWPSKWTFWARQHNTTATCGALLFPEKWFLREVLLTGLKKLFQLCYDVFFHPALFSQRAKGQRIFPIISNLVWDSWLGMAGFLFRTVNPWQTEYPVWWSWSSQVLSVSNFRNLQNLSHGSFISGSRNFAAGWTALGCSWQTFRDFQRMDHRVTFSSDPNSRKWLVTSDQKNVQFGHSSN